MEVTLKNDRIGIAADTLGAELTSLKTADGLELLWQGDDNHWKSRSPILFPVVGGLPDDQYELEDKRYKMAWVCPALRVPFDRKGKRVGGFPVERE